MEIWQKVGVQPWRSLCTSLFFLISGLLYIVSGRARKGKELALPPIQIPRHLHCGGSSHPLFSQGSGAWWLFSHRI